MRFEVPDRGVDLFPVVRRPMNKNGHVPLAQVADEVLFDGVRCRRLDVLQDVGFEDEDARAGGRLGVRWTLEDASSIIAGETHGLNLVLGKDESRRRPMVPMKIHRFGEVGVGEQPGAENHRRSVHPILGRSQGPNGPQRPFFRPVSDHHAEIGPVLQQILDLPRLIGKAEQNLPDSGVLQKRQLVEHHRLVRDGDKGLGRVQRQWPQPGAGPPGQYQSFHGRPHHTSSPAVPPSGGLRARLPAPGL